MEICGTVYTVTKKSVKDQNGNSIFNFSIIKPGMKEFDPFFK